MSEIDPALEPYRTVTEAFLPSKDDWECHICYRTILQAPQDFDALAREWMAHMQKYHNDFEPEDRP